MGRVAPTAGNGGKGGGARPGRDWDVAGMYFGIISHGPWQTATRALGAEGAPFRFLTGTPVAQQDV